MGIYNTFGTDKSLEQTGIIINYGDDGQFRIARSGGANSAYMNYMRARLKTVRHQMDTDTLPEAVAESIALDAFVRYVLIDWKDVTDADGKPLKHSLENAKKLMHDLPDLYADLLKQSNDFTVFRNNEVKTAAKNSENTSDGN